MSISFGGHEISKLKIVEDDENARDSLAEIVEDVNIAPDKIEGPLSGIEDFIKNQSVDADAFIFDHNLKQSGYATFNGAEAVAKLYKKRPSVLCTTWANAAQDSISLYRRYIPSLIHSDEINSDILARALEICVNEFKDNFLPSREPIRTLIRIECLDDIENPKIVNAVVSSWNPKEVVRFPYSLIPEGIRGNIQEGARLWAEVNLGAEDYSELFFDSFEFRG